VPCRLVPPLRGPVCRGSVPADPVRAVQHALYRAAKADPGRGVPRVAGQDLPQGRSVACVGHGVPQWRAPGIDEIILAEVEQRGVDRLLEELAGELREGRYRLLPTRRVLVPKPGTTEQRPLSIPAVRDRIVQAAVKIVLERSSRPTCCRVRSGFARSERRMMPCRFSWTSPGGVAGGWSRRTSPTVSRRFRSRS